MGQFHRDGRGHDARVPGITKLSGQQHEGRPEALAAGLAQVRRSVGEHGVLSLRGRAQAILDKRQPVDDIGRERGVSDFASEQR